MWLFHSLKKKGLFKPLNYAMTLWAVKSMWPQRTNSRTHMHTHTELDFEKFTAHSLVAGWLFGVKWSGDQRVTPLRRPPSVHSEVIWWQTHMFRQTWVSRDCPVHQPYSSTKHIPQYHTCLSQTSISMLIFVFCHDSGSFSTQSFLFENISLLTYHLLSLTLSHYESHL